jgi:hypothetical protein
LQKAVVEEEQEGLVQLEQVVMLVEVEVEVRMQTLLLRV